MVRQSLLSLEVYVAVILGHVISVKKIKISRHGVWSKVCLTFDTFVLRFICLR